MNQRVLIIDDDTNLLSGLRRQLHGRFDVETVESGEQAVARVSDAEPFAVALCDMRMPGLNGVQTLARIGEASPDTVRMMLTDNSDQQTAVDAVNDGRIFRFLNKPVSPEKLVSALDAGVEQYRLVTAEEDLLSKTLAGSVRVLTDVLSLANPAAFARTSCVRRLCSQLADRLGIESKWEIEMAASLSLVGCLVTHGASKPPAQISHDLIAHIPRLETVAQIVANQDQRLDQSNVFSSETSIQAIPYGARILKVALDFDELIASGTTPYAALSKLRSRHGWYDPQGMEALEELVGIVETAAIRLVSPLAMPENAILAEDLRAVDGTLLLSKGQEVSRALRHRLIDYAATGQIGEAITISVPLETELATN